jgi:hypothetical protein
MITTTIVKMRNTQQTSRIYSLGDSRAQQGTKRKDEVPVGEAARMDKMVALRSQERVIEDSKTLRQAKGRLKV